MKTLKIELLGNGDTIIVKNHIYFDNENESTIVEVEYPVEYEEYSKRCDIVTEHGFKTIKLGNQFTLSRDELTNGFMSVQPIAYKDDVVVKWAISKIRINGSLNVVESDESIDISLAQQLINMFEQKQDKELIDGKTWNDLEALMEAFIKRK